MEAIVKMAAGLQIDVVAEGVETLEQAEGLQHLGCVHAQGFYYARPMPPDDVIEQLGTSLPLRRVMAALPAAVPPAAG